ncbi:MAG: hypothetical protein KAK00_06270 [Nanoarchaeota archaeon]|nr:hypothetical protein [Nanoarchaeota archaeon]
MKRIKNALKEIDVSLKNIDMFLIFIKALVLLMVSFLLLFIIGVKSYYAFVPAIIYFVSSVFVEARIDHIRRVENKYSKLNEKLITARDYQDEDNLVLDELEHDIVRDLHEVKLSSFLSYSKIFVMIFLLIISVISSLFIASKDIRLVDLDIILQDAMRRLAIEEEEAQKELDFNQGEAAIMEVGDERIEVEINPVGIDFDFNDVTETGEYEFSTAFPRDVFISSGAAYESEFTEEQQALIKRYFDKKKG